MKIGVKIRQKRQNKGYSQEYMAGQMDVSTKTYRKIEEGISKIDLKRLAVISQLLEVEIFDLIKTDSQYSFYCCKYNKSKMITQEKEPNIKVIELYENLLKTKDTLIKHLEITIENFTSSNHH